MSIFNLINQFREGVERTSTLATTSDAQRRRWLKTALAEVSRKRPREDERASISISSTATYAELPRDYYSASEDALLAVEYAYSSAFLAGHSKRGHFAAYNQFSNRIRATLDPIGSRRIYPTQPPEVKNIPIYGVTRRALQLHIAATTDRTETLLYNAFWTIEDHQWEVLILDTPTNNLTITIAGTVFTWKTSATLDTEIGIASTLNGCTANLAAKVSAKISSLTTIAQGQIVVIRGKTVDLDFTVTADGTLITATEYPAINTVNGDIEQRVFAWMEGEYWEYYATDPTRNLQFRVVADYLQKAKDLKVQALDGLYVCTA